MSKTIEAAPGSIVETWEKYEGTVSGYGFDGALVVEVSALQDSRVAAKWGERRTPGRAWAAYLPSGEIKTGHAADLRAAKAEALAAYAKATA